MNKTLLEKARCILLQTKMSKVFWVEAVHTASHIVNRSPASAIDFKTLNEVWSGEPSNYSSLRIFGCPAIMLMKESLNQGLKRPYCRVCRWSKWVQTLCLST
uniref:Putative ovule protein n=1 Tax=Solanum chacoense TaxID=4108 RepID=A0A0V0GVZ3_SOLCH